MPKTEHMTAELVLVGGGHAHVEVLRRFAMQPPANVRVSLVASDVLTPYSGMLPGYIAGHYTREECHIDLGPLCRHAGARLIHSRAIGLDPIAHRLRCDTRPDLYYDTLSLDTGSTPAIRTIEGAVDHAIAIKPVDGFLRRLEEVERRLLRHEGAFRMVVVGGGAGGVEIALCVQHRLRGLLAREGRSTDALQITLVTADEQLLMQHSPAVRQRFERLLERRGITVLRAHRVTRINAEAVLCEPFKRLPAESVLILTHAAAPAWLRASGLEVDEGGFVRVDQNLRSLSHPEVFAAGDIAAFAQQPLIKNGVYAVRQGPVLAANLRAALLGGRLRPFRPQARTLALISTGDRSAVASRGGMALQGWWLWRWKNRIDRRFMRRYRDLPPMPGETKMRCGGCGAKTGSAVLASALADLRRAPVPAGVESGPAEADDAAVFEPPPGMLLVQSVDQFPSFIDDPWLFGRITALHCLGDLYAMGADAHSALAMVTLPPAGADAQAADLRALLAGATDALREAGAQLLGGHTGEGTQLAFGLAVTGYVAREALLRKTGLESGDRLVLTRPLGTGVVLAAHMRGRCPSATLQHTLAAMQQSSRNAVPVLRAHGVRACTDVTGFGLLGSLGELLAASRCHGRIESRALPALPGARELLQKGFASTLAPTNAAHRALLGSTSPEPDPLLFDPQTAGGLLAGVPRGRAEDCVRVLRDAGYDQTCIIGEVVDGEPGRVTLLAAG